MDKDNVNIQKIIHRTSEQHKKNRALKEQAQTCPECKNQGKITGSCTNVHVYYHCECDCGCQWESKIG